MYELSKAVSLLKKCQKLFQRETTRLNNVIKKSPEGSLIIEKHPKGKSYCYRWQRYEEGKVIRTYLPKSKRLRIIQKLSDKKFAKTCLKNLEKALNSIEIFLKSCPAPDSFGVKLADQLAQQNYITSTATALSTEKYCKQWKESFTEFLSFHDEDKVHVSTDGIAYRSKSESMIAGELHTLGITYVYDARKNLFFTCETKKYPLTKEQIHMAINEIIQSATY